MDDLQSVIAELEARFEWVVRFQLDVASDMDRAPEKGAFAFVILVDSESAMIVEGSISGDGSEATATVWGVRHGERAVLSTLELDGQVLHSLACDLGTP